MADETISTRIVANADFSSLIADVHKVTASLSKLQEQLANSNKMMANQVAVMNRSFSDTIRSTGQFSSHFVSLQSDVEKFGKNLDGGRLKLRDYFGTFQSHVKTSGGLIRDLARQQVAMQNAILQPLGRNAQGLMQFNVHVPRGLDEIKNKTAIARQELQIMNRVIQDGAVQLINWGKNTQWAGRQLTVGLTLPIAAFGKAAADAFRQADQELVRLTKVYGDTAGTSAAELGRVRQEVIATSKELSAAFGTNFKDTIALAADIAATGKTGADLINSVKETSRLAVLGEVDRQDAMKATLAIQTAFKQNTEELAESINFLNAVENQTSTTLNDLVEAIPKAGPVIKGLGGSIQDLALYLTAMREGGINASEGANALKSGLASLINPTKQSVGVMQDFGIDILGMVQKNAGNTTSLLLDLQAALDNLDPLSRAQAIEQLFGKFQFARISALLNNLGRQGSQTLQVLDLMKISASELEQVAARELTAVTESASGKYRRAIESLKADLAGLGDSFLTIATNIINIVDKALDFFNNLPKPIKQAMTFLGALTAVAGPLIMLTGVLANFFGYIIKGVMHMKAFFKGGEGWKYLTPEMLAAEKAGRLVEQSFYSDAKAAAVLQTALRNLIDEFALLEAKAKSGAVAVNPAVSTMAGNLVMGAGVRVVNPQHPLAGAMGTRASTHMVPRSGMTEEQRMAQTIFGLVPGSIPVNRKIGDAPQIYMNEPLPPVPGLTTIGGVSTGVVSGEAARWHSMMATLAMQSKAEIENLKKQIAATGVVSKDFMMQFDDILPIVSKLTDNAAKQSGLIVAELRAGKITVDQARQQIIALNLETERMITQAVTTQATAMGRTINPTIVPTLNQPVVDPTGKSNMRELFKKSKTRDLIDKISRSLGVRTSGAGYNIETTRPKKFNKGGAVYLNSGNIVPGPNVNQDVVPAMLTPGEFVVNREATARNLPLLMAINGGVGGRGPGFRRGGRPTSTSTSDFYMSGLMGLMKRSMDPDFVATQRMRHIIHDAAGIMSLGDQYRINIDPQDAVGMATDLRNNIDRDMSGKPETSLASITNKHTRDLEKQLKNKYGINLRWRSASRPTGVQRQYYTRAVKGIMSMRSMSTHDRQLASSIFRGSRARFQGFVSEHAQPFETMTARGTRDEFVPKHNIGHAFAGSASINQATRRLSVMGISPDITYRSPSEQMMQAQRAASGLGYGSAENLLSRENVIRSGFRSSSMSKFLMGMATRGRMRIGRNSGGIIPGYNRGGVVGGKIPGVQYYQDGGQAKPLGGMGMFMGGMGMQMAGQSIGGGVGTAMSGIGTAMTFMPMLGMLPKLNMQLSTTQKRLIEPIGPLKRLTEGFNNKAGALKGLTRVFGPVLRGLSLLTRAFSPIGIALTIGAISVKKAIDAWKDHQEALRVNRLEYGMSAEVIKKAGYSMTDYNGTVKKAIADTKALQERNRMLYETMFQANIPIKMTIAEYKKLRKETKEKMPDLIELFNQKSNSEINTVATRLKAQFMSMGDSVEVATAKVFALMSQSNKAEFAAAAIGSKGFGAIKDSVDAAIASAGSFDDAMAKGDAKAASDALLVTFEGIGQAIEDNAKKNNLEFSASMEQVLKKMATTGKGQVAINKSVLEELKKQNPELAKILNSTDTATSAWAKYQLALKNVNLDLQTLSGEAANAALKLQSLVTANTSATLKNTSGIKEQYAKYESLQAKIKDLEKAARGQSVKQQIDSKKVIEGLNAQIKKIKEAADAKIKALRSQAQAENDNLELQKLQLEYQEAIARGDQDAAARAQIALQQYTNQVQSRKAEENILAKAELEIKPLQDKIDALSKKNQDLADKAALAGESLANLQSQASTLKTKLGDLENAVASAAFNKLIMGDAYEGSKQQKSDLAATESGRRGLGLKSSITKVTAKSPDEARSMYASGVSGDQFSNVKGGAKDIVSSVVKSLEKGVDAKQVNIYTSQLGGASMGGRTKSNPLNIAQSSSYAMKKDGQLSDDAEKAIIREYGLQKGEFFKYGNTTYEVLKTGWGFGDRATPVKRAQGGRLVPGVAYSLNDGGKVEGIKFDTPGYVYPNINTMARYNIPRDPTSRVNSGANNSFNNNVYNIDIDLNGTNVTADDIMKRFKAELALINAKEGRVRTVGGNY